MLGVVDAINVHEEVHLHDRASVLGGRHLYFHGGGVAVYFIQGGHGWHIHRLFFGGSGGGGLGGRSLGGGGLGYASAGGLGNGSGRGGRGL